MNHNIPSKLLFELIDDSYSIVVSKLPKKIKEELKELLDTLGIAYEVDEDGNITITSLSKSVILF